MNAHQRRKSIRRYGREAGLDSIPFKLLMLAKAGEWRQAEELRVSLGLPDPLSRLRALWPKPSGMQAYHFTVARSLYWMEGETESRTVPRLYHEWRERREVTDDG